MSRPDPIFAAIEAHKAALLEDSTAASTADALQHRDGYRPGRWEWSDGKSLPPVDCSDPPEMIAAELRLGEASDGLHRAMLALLSTTPTTMAGVVAALEYAGAYEYPSGVGWSDTVLNGAAEFHDLAVQEAAAKFLLRLAASVRSISTDGQISGGDNA